MSEERVPISYEDLAISNYFEQEALVRLLVRKGIITKEELIKEVQEVQREQSNRRREN